MRLFHACARDPFCCGPHCWEPCERGFGRFQDTDGPFSKSFLFKVVWLSVGIPLCVLCLLCDYSLLFVMDIVPLLCCCPIVVGWYLMFHVVVLLQTPTKLVHVYVVVLWLMVTFSCVICCVRLTCFRRRWTRFPVQGRGRLSLRAPRSWWVSSPVLFQMLSRLAEYSWTNYSRSNTSSWWFQSSKKDHRTLSTVLCLHM